MKSAINLCLFPEAKGGPFVFWDSLAEGFERAARFGFDAVELFPASPEELDAREVKRLCDKHKLKVSAVGTGAGWVKHKLRLTDPDPAVRRQAQQFIGGIIDLGAKFGAPAILGSMQGRWDGAVSREQAVTWLAEALEQLAPRAQALGTPLLYEFLNRYETNLFNRVAESLEFLDTSQNYRLGIFTEMLSTIAASEDARELHRLLVGLMRRAFKVRCYAEASSVGLPAGSFRLTRVWRRDKIAPSPAQEL